MTRRDFQRLAELRVAEATALVRSRKEIGAYYLAGYAVECALKACIAKATRRHEFPPKSAHVQKLYSHNLEELLRIAGLERQLEADSRANPGLAINWGVVKNWSQESRYTNSRLKGRDLCAAINGPNGILLWIKQRW